MRAFVRALSYESCWQRVASTRYELALRLPSCSTMKNVEGRNAGTDGVSAETKLRMAAERVNAVRREIAKVIVGQDDVVEGVLICLLSGGHVLLEGVPGLGKTTLLRTLS